MGMQCHFAVADIPEHFKVHKHADKQDEHENNGNDAWIDYYIVVDPESFYFSTDKDHVMAWFDIGQLSETGVKKLHWLIQQRICFSTS